MIRMVMTLSIALACLIGVASAQPIEQWVVYEITLDGPANGNPFVEVILSAEFRNGDAVFVPDGFYDGDGVYRVRFMPNALGTWTYTTRCNRPALDGKSSSFECVAPSSGNTVPCAWQTPFASRLPTARHIYPWEPRAMRGRIKAPPWKSKR